MSPMHWLYVVVMIGTMGCYEVDDNAIDASVPNGTCAGVHQFPDGSVDAASPTVDNTHGCDYDAANLPIIECGKSGCVIVDRCYVGQ